MRAKHFVVIILFICLLATGCTELVKPVSQAKIELKLGDAWRREKDGMEMVFVPGGIFSMGSRREMV